MYFLIRIGMNIMLSNEQRDLMRTKGTMLGRILIGLLFFFSGLGIVIDGPMNTAMYFANLGIPLATLAVWPVIIIKLGAGGALIAGYRVGVAAGLLILFTLLATLIAHMDINDVNLFKNLAIVGGLMYVMAYGAGDGWKITNGDR
jgi:putative oxidoreductase